MSRRAAGVASVRVEGCTAIVRYVPGHVGSPATLRRVAVAALSRSARGRVRVGKPTRATASLSNGMHAVAFTAS